MANPKTMLQDYGLFSRHDFDTNSGTNGRRPTLPSRPPAFGAGAEVLASFGAVRLGGINPFQSPKSDFSNLVAILGPIRPIPKGFSRTSEQTGYGHWQ